MKSLSGQQRLMAVVVAVLLIAGTVYLSVNFSFAPLVIVGVPGIAAYLLWHMTGLRKAFDPAIALPPFLLTVAGFTFNTIEEYLGHYGPSVGRLFGFSWTDQAFVIISVALVGALGLVAVGLYYRVPVAGFVAAVFLTTRIAELFIFIFPLWRPTIQPTVAGSISQVVAGTLVRDMPNNYVHAVGHYYFPGMFTVILPTIPAVYALYQIWVNRPARPGTEIRGGGHHTEP